MNMLTSMLLCTLKHGCYVSSRLIHIIPIICCGMSCFFIIHDYLIYMNYIVVTFHMIYLDINRRIIISVFSFDEFDRLSLSD